MKKRCQKCLGTGTEIDHEETGREMWRLRNKKGYTVAKVARNMGVDASYVSYLESGKREWSLDLVERYLRALAFVALLLPSLALGVGFPPLPIASTHLAVFRFAATCTDTNGLDSDYSNEVFVTNLVTRSVIFAWDVPACTNVITNYTLYMGGPDSAYTNHVSTTGTNLTLVLPYGRAPRPAPPRLIVLSASVTNWPSYTWTNPTGTFYVRTNLSKSGGTWTVTAVTSQCPVGPWSSWSYWPGWRTSGPPQVKLSFRPLVP